MRNQIVGENDEKYLMKEQVQVNHWLAIKKQQKISHEDI